MFALRETLYLNKFELDLLECFIIIVYVLVYTSMPVVKMNIHTCQPIKILFLRVQSEVREMCTVVPLEQE